MERNYLEEVFDADWLLNVLSKAVSNLTFMESSKANQNTEYQASSDYIWRLRQPLLACGANGTLQVKVTCYCYKDKGHMKENCIHLNQKIAHDLQKQ